MGSPARCYSSCSAQSGPQGVSSPNNNAEADGMASIIAHELAETASDPLINAWCVLARARQPRGSGSVMAGCFENGCLRLKRATLPRRRCSAVRRFMRHVIG